MRVGFVLISWGIGGSEKRFRNLYNYLTVKSNHDYYLIINQYLLKKLNEVGVKIGNDRIKVVLTDDWKRNFDRPAPDIKHRLGLRLPGPNFLIHRFYNQAHSLILRNVGQPVSLLNLDVVHYVFPFGAEHLGTAKAKVFSCQDTNLKNTLLKNKFFVKALYSDGYFDIASERIRETITKETGIIDKNRLRVNPCSFIDYSQTFIAPKEPVIIFSGSLLPIKNPLLFVDLVHEIHQKKPDIQAWILGDGSLKTEVERRIHKLKLKDTIRVQFAPNPASILSRALIYVSIQSIDNYHSQSLMEAMACGCAIVASDVGETYKLVSDEVGFRVGLNTDALSEKVLWLLDHPDIAAQMGKRARKKVMSEQTVERFCDYLENLYMDASSGS